MKLHHVPRIVTDELGEEHLDRWPTKEEFIAVDAEWCKCAGCNKLRAWNKRRQQKITDVRDHPVFKAIEATRNLPLPD